MHTADYLMLAIILIIVLYVWRNRLLFPMVRKALVYIAIRRYELRTKEDLRCRDCTVWTFIHWVNSYDANARGFHYAIIGDPRWKMLRARAGYRKDVQRANTDAVMNAIRDRLPESVAR